MEMESLNEFLLSHGETLQITGFAFRRASRVDRAEYNSLLLILRLLLAPDLLDNLLTQLDLGPLLLMCAEVLRRVKKE